MDFLRLTHLLGDCKNLGKKCAFTEKIKVFQLCGAVQQPFLGRTEGRVSLFHA
jgi:hypothetical protein